MSDVDTLAIRGRLLRARRGLNRDELARRYVTDVEALLDALDEMDQWIHEHALVKSLARAEAAQAMVRRALDLAEKWAAADAEPVSDNGIAVLCTINRLGNELLAALKEESR